MRIPRIYQSTALSVGQIIELDAQATAHLTRVLRLRVGDSLVVFNGRRDGGGDGREENRDNGNSGEYEAVVSSIGRRSATVKLGAPLNRKVESPLELILVQGVSRGERMDFTMQKATELGITAINPVKTERTVVNLKGDRLVRRQTHWQAIVNSACEQSGRNVVPEVNPIVPLSQWLEQSSSSPGIKLVLHHQAEASLEHLQKPEGPVTLLIGPEGGLSSDEIRAAQTADFRPIRLGPRVMRTETAAIAALSVLQWIWGDFSENS